MAQGSEKIGMHWIKGAERKCWRCGAEIKNLQKDVGEVRTRFPGMVREILCMECHLGRREWKQ